MQINALEDPIGISCYNVPMDSPPLALVLLIRIIRTLCQKNCTGEANWVLTPNTKKRGSLWNNHIIVRRAAIKSHRSDPIVLRCESTLWPAVVQTRNWPKGLSHSSRLYITSQSQSWVYLQQSNIDFHIRSLRYHLHTICANLVEVSI